MKKNIYELYQSEIDKLRFLPNMMSNNRSISVVAISQLLYHYRNYLNKLKIQNREKLIDELVKDGL